MYVYVDVDQVSLLLNLESIVIRHDWYLCQDSWIYLISQMRASPMAWRIAQLSKVDNLQGQTGGSYHFIWRSDHLKHLVQLQHHQPHAAAATDTLKCETVYYWKIKSV